MTKAELYVSNGIVKSFTIKGHSNHGKYGQDIVCASISSTSLMIVNGIVELTNLNVDYTIKEGLIKLDLNNLSNTEYESIKLFIDSYILILEQIQSDYPLHFKIIFKEV